MYWITHYQCHYGEVTRVDRGPYRSLWWAKLVAHCICGDWDYVSIHKRSP